MRSGAPRGFTLLELLVVLAIVALMAALVPPLLSGMGGTTELRGAARQLAAGMRSARNRAISSQQETRLILDLEQRFFSLEGRRYSLPKSVGLKLFTAQSEVSDEEVGAIRFFPDGSSTGGRITVTGKRSEYLVDVDWLTGRVRISDQVVQ